MYLFGFCLRRSWRHDNEDLKAANIPAAPRQSAAFLSLHGAASLEDKTQDMKVKTSERVRVGGEVVCRVVRQSQIGRQGDGGDRAVDVRSTDGYQQKRPAEALMVRGRENIFATKKPQMLQHLLIFPIQGEEGRWVRGGKKENEKGENRARPHLLPPTGQPARWTGCTLQPGRAEWLLAAAGHCTDSPGHGRCPSVCNRRPGSEHQHHRRRSTRGGQVDRRHRKHTHRVKNPHP